MAYMAALERVSFTLLLAVLIVFTSRVYAGEPHGHATSAAAIKGKSNSPYASLSPFQCSGTMLKCATAVAPAWTPDGTLWLVWVANGAVMTASSRDLGASFSEPTRIAHHGDRLDIGPDAMPQIVIDKSGRIVVAYSVFRDDHWNAQVLV